MQNLYATKESQKLTSFEMFVELIQESTELGGAMTRSDLSNIEEELCDVMQWCINIAKEYNIDINRAITKHQGKLLSRGHEFILPHEEKIKHIIEGGQSYVRIR